MINQLLSLHSNRRFLSLFRPALLEPRKLHHVNVAALEQQWRLQSNSAAVPDIPNHVAIRKRTVSFDERRQMVEAYVDQYRVMNAGKFPSANNVKKHVGGCYYKVRAILQEYEYGCKLPALNTAVKTSTAGKTATVNGISDGGVALDCELPKKDDLKLGKECDKTFSNTDMSNEINILEFPGVPVALSLSEKSLANETPMALVKDDPKFQAKSSQHPKVTSTSGNLEAKEVDKSADQDLESDQSTRCKVTDVGKLSLVLSEETQVSDSYNKSSAITQELDNLTVEAEMKRTSAIGVTLDSQVKIGSIANVNDRQVSTDSDSNSQKEEHNYSCQQMIDESILTESKEVTTDDTCRKENVELKLKRKHQKASHTNVDGGDCIVSPESEELLQQPSSMMDSSAVGIKATATENNEVSANSSLPSEVTVASRNSDIDETVASLQALKSDKISGDTTVQQTGDNKQSQESSLWGNVKLLASNIMSFWRNK